MSVYVIANQKGGVGKTTTVLMFASILGNKGKKVLVVDCDSQMNATNRLESDDDQYIDTIYDLMTSEISVKKTSETICKAKPEFKNVYFIPGNPKISRVEPLLPQFGQETILKRILDPFYKKFDFIIIDTPPTVNILTINALASADKVIIPCDMSLDSIDGADLIRKTLDEMKKLKLSSASLHGIFISGIEKKNSNLTKEIIKRVGAEFDKKTVKGSIPASTKVGEAAMKGLTSFHLFKDHPVTNAYKELTKKFF